MSRAVNRGQVGRLLCLMVLLVIPLNLSAFSTHEGDLNQRDVPAVEEPTWEAVFQTISQGMPLVAAEPPESVPVLPKGENTLRAVVEELCARNGMGWDVERWGEPQQRQLLVLHRQCSEDIRSYALEDAGLRWRQTYALLRFIDALPQEKLIELSGGPLEVYRLPEETRKRLNEVANHLSVSDQRFLLSKAEADRGGGEGQRERILVGVRVVPMVKLSTPSRSVNFCLFPWTALSYEDVVEGRDGTLRWAGGEQEPLRGMSLKGKGPIVQTLLHEILVEDKPVVVSKSGWKTVAEIFGDSTQKPVELVVDRRIRQQRVWLTRGSYPRGVLRRAVLRALCLALREIGEPGRGLVFVGFIRHPVGWDDLRYSQRCAQAFNRLLPLWLPWMERKLTTERLPFRTQELWGENRAFASFTLEQQAALARRWGEEEWAHSAIRGEHFQKEGDISPETFSERLRRSEAQVTVQPGVLFTVGMYQPQREDEKVLLRCVWEAKLLM